MVLVVYIEVYVPSVVLLECFYAWINVLEMENAEVLHYVYLHLRLIKVLENHQLTMI